MRSTRWRSLVFGVFLAAGACDPNEGRVLVVADTDLMIGTELAEIRATIRSSDGSVQMRDFRVVRRTAPGAAPTPDEIPLSFAVEPRPGRLAGDFEVVLDGYSSTGPTTAHVTRRAITGFIAGRTLVLPMPLLRSCLDADPCPDRETCDRGVCVGAAIDPASLPSAMEPGDELSDAGRRDGDGGAADATVSTDAGSGHAVFVTSMALTPVAFGGLAGADGVCQGLARDAGLTGSFRAILSSSAEGARDRIAVAGEVRTTRDELVAVGGELWGALRAPIDRDERGLFVSNQNVWTGTCPDGSPAPGATCSDWSGTGMGEIGRTSVTDSRWISLYGCEAVTNPCSITAHLYCISLP